MATAERRNSMPLDQAYNYCRLLEQGLEQPTLYKVCGALQTLDAAIESARDDSGYWARGFSLRVWSQVRALLYNMLITSFPGYFLVYAQGASSPVEPGTPWPEKGVVEFFPDRARRREDSYASSLEDLELRTETTLRWCLAEGRQHITPADFPEADAEMDEESEVENLMDRLYDICVKESSHGKRRAHERWWQLYWQANSCGDKRAKHELKKQMVKLQAVWGRPS